MNKTNSDKKISGNFSKFGNFLEFLSSDIFQRSCEKQCVLHLEHMRSISQLHPMQRLA